MEKPTSISQKTVSTSRNKVSLKKLLTPNFKNLNKPLNKRILFSLDRKSISTNRNEELVKNCLHSQEYLADGKKLFLNSQKNSFYKEQ